ncbi:MAG: hypothetical protein JOZ08_21675 [Verrucomicrobia bacterium]|jgi:hypothetical protein|nr:hypothetical protein [Verrucomicrobiota bacterium]MBV8273793.1 hypothetical protein [Verrucomicrobiota bacterium]
MKRIIAIIGLALIPVLSPLSGQAQQSKGAVSALHRSHFTVSNLSTREEKRRTYVDGEITSNAKKEATMVRISVRWFDEDNKVIAKDSTSVSHLAPGETLPFHAYTENNHEIVRYDVTVESAF